MKFKVGDEVSGRVCGKFKIVKIVPQKNKPGEVWYVCKEICQVTGKLNCGQIMFEEECLK